MQDPEDRTAIGAPLQLQDRVREAFPDVSELVWKASRAAARTASNWGLPATAVSAVLVAPIFEFDLDRLRDLAHSIGHETLELARRLVSWRPPVTALFSGSSQSTQDYSVKLRRCIRETYTGAPGVAFVLLLMAEHDARFSQDQLRNHGTASETEAVFVPLAGAFGMWQLRRRWLDECTRILFRDEYLKTEHIVGPALFYSNEHRKELIEKKIRIEASRGGKQLATDSGQQKDDAKWLDKHRWVLAKLEAYQAFEQQLGLCVGEAGISPPPSVSLITSLPGTTFRRMKTAESPEELASRIGVRVICRSILDCYRMLGIVHRLGSPIDPRFSVRFIDHIASPQPNGYRALHTAIIFRSRGSDFSETLIEVRLLTSEMHHVNEFGIVAYRYQDPDQAAKVQAWWNALERRTRDLRGRFKCSDGTTVESFVSSLEIGSHSDPLYVFTPQGEIVLLPEGSTALDFAYHIHTDLGNHASKAEVNGRSVPYNHILSNGDIVRIQYEAHTPGPDLSWANLVATPYAKSKIRAGLTKRAKAIHPGRAILENALLKMIQFYKREKQYDLTFTTGRLDAFLYRIARVRNLRDTNQLYERVSDGSVGVEKLVRSLISEDLAAVIVDSNDKPLPYPIHRISMCDVCRPVPGDHLVLRKRRTGTSAHGVIVHSRHCRVIPGGDDVISSKWADNPSPQGTLIDFEILANDRYRLLGELLDVVYEEDGSSSSQSRGTESQRECNHQGNLRD